MELRLVTASLWRRRGMMLLAVTAVAIAAAVCTATLLVSRDLGAKAAHELRALGPNLVLMPAAADASAGVDAPAIDESRRRHDPGREPPIQGFADPRFATATAELLDETLVRSRMAAAGVSGTPLLYVSATVNHIPVTLVGADLEALLALHPTWKASATGGSWVGARLERRLGLAPGQAVRVAVAGGGPERVLRLGTTLAAGGAEDEAWWVPLPLAQALAAQPGRVSLAHARLPDGPAGSRALAALERGGGLSAQPLRALAGAEARLLDRARRLMTLVAVAVLAAAALCAFGTLTDLALERRREVALLKALGGTRRHLLRLLAAESVAVGLAGGAAGWLLGLALAQLVGHHVFHSAVAVRWEAAPMVFGLSLVVAVLAGIVPLRLALAVDPAPALKEDS
jgi:putative ABC transport system permease protein